MCMPWNSGKQKSIFLIFEEVIGMCRTKLIALEVQPFILFTVDVFLDDSCRPVNYHSWKISLFEYYSKTIFLFLLNFRFYQVDCFLWSEKEHKGDPRYIVIMWLMNLWRVSQFTNEIWSHCPLDFNCLYELIIIIIILIIIDLVILYL